MALSWRQQRADMRAPTKPFEPYKLVRKGLPEEYWKTSGGVVGYFIASYDELRSALGPINTNATDGGGKVHNAWLFREEFDPRSTVYHWRDVEPHQFFTLYDYDGENARKIGGTYEWHIGGRQNPRAFARWLSGRIGVPESRYMSEDQYMLKLKQRIASKRKHLAAKRARAGAGQARGKTRVKLGVAGKKSRRKR